MNGGKLYIDLSITAQTLGGGAVYAWELCHHLMAIAAPLQVIALTCPFEVVGKAGLNRWLYAGLRDLLWNPWLKGLGVGAGDYVLFPTIAVPSRLYGRSYGVVVHDLFYWHNPQYLRWRGRHTLRRLPQTLNYARHIFAISAHTAGELAENFNLPPEKIIIAPNGLSCSFRHDAPLRDRLNGIDLTQPYLLHVGNFDPRKNLEFLIEVYEHFEAKFDPQSRINLVLTGGESWQSRELGERIQTSPCRDHIHILGKVASADLPSLYRGAKMLIFPSLCEGFGFPVLEALSQGIPALVARNSALAAWEQWGATGLDRFDRDEWAEAIAQLLAHNPVTPYHVDRIRSYFQWQHTAQIVAQTLGLPSTC